MKSFPAVILPALFLCWIDLAAQPLTAALVDTSSTFRVRSVPNGLLDVDEGVLRSSYNVRARVHRGLSPAEAALEHLSTTSAYGISSPGDDLILREVKGGTYATHLLFQQVLSGIPVYNRDVKVNLDANGQPTMVINGFAPHLEDVEEFDSEPSVSPELAVQIAASQLGAESETAGPILMVLPFDPPALSWKVTAWSNAGPGEGKIFIDAHSGDVLYTQDLTQHARPSKAAEKARVDAPSSVINPKSPIDRVSFVDGLGFVFDPDPISSAGVDYGGAYVDAEDADTPELNAQRFEVTLRDISLGADGLYRLEGPYVTIVGSSCGDDYTPPAETSPDGFRYTRAHPHFEAVNVYYHIDKSQRYIQSLDIGFPILEEPVRANPRGQVNDDTNLVGDCFRFGLGAVDDGEDVDVILHAYAIALLDDAVPEGLRLSEAGIGYYGGWRDYWAASYSRFLSEEDPRIPDHNWRKLFNWDGNTSCWQGRTLDHPGHYPDEVVVYPTSGCISYGALTQAGMLWATTMMQIYDTVGREVMDRLHLASFGYLSATAGWEDFAAALLQADRDLYGGIHQEAIAEPLVQRGFVPEATSAEKPEPLHESAALHQNYPNPFSGSTEIQLQIRRESFVSVDVFDVVGRKVRTLTSDRLAPGRHTLIWDGRDERGRAMAGGVYIYHMHVDEITLSRAMLLVR